ncbi:patatin-like phospholipase family protein [Candidatus Odyssella thessalonicensis]|uniref:patatin-like phospholipase family protein n=1 Tax=Candidatus Odyssella thessalonicensis TaxID=84647 RepID=UPI000225A93D|nr:patatin-like phospholipase family protein [Candidatus Odyssella thessalonicensis]
MEWFKSLVYGTQVIASTAIVEEVSPTSILQPLALPTKAITIDGGGMRGLYTIELMKAVEGRLNGKISEHAQIIAGTSTGSILGFGLAIDRPLETLANLYINHGQDIFYQTDWEYFENGDGLTGPKYDPSKFESILNENFEQMKLSDLKCHHVMAFATNITQQRLQVFDTKVARNSPEDDAPIWFTIRSSTAAPTYFAPTLWKGDALCDGGLLVNNPSTVTLTQLIEVYGWGVLPTLKMVSFGTGTFNTGISYEYASTMGTLKWAAPISDMMIKSASTMYCQLSAKLLSADQLVRLNGSLSRDLTLDNYCPTNLRAIQEAALSYIKDNPELIDRAAKMLQN